MTNISNTEVKVPTGLENNDKDYANILLSKLKDLEKNYTVALTEASNEYLYERLKRMYDDISILHRDTFEMMFRKGWYALKVEDQSSIKTEHKKLLKEFKDLGV